MMKLYAAETSRLGLTLKVNRPGELVESAPNVL